ncbi:hypothetical protein [Erwinia sp.]|uniref:hypothetical protein n=1 Tax=Erwinia citreus TaxID=558 RepID=UPI00289F8BF1|nr:hypothetical protein [Erwinia sp.]
MCNATKKYLRQIYRNVRHILSRILKKTIQEGSNEIARQATEQPLPLILWSANIRFTDWETGTNTMHQITWSWEKHFSLDGTVFMVLPILIVVGLWARIVWRVRKKRELPVDNSGLNHANVSKSFIKADTLTDIVIALAGTSALLMLLWLYS